MINDKTQLKTENMTKEYSDVTAVNDMNLDIKNGEFVSLIGPSGCGKSTTLAMIAGLTDPTSGTITISGEDVTTYPPKDRDIAMVFQNIALFPHMTVYENMSFGLRLQKVDQEVIDEKVQEAANILQLNGMMDRMPDELSGGQRQRVAIGRAIVLDPEVFLMDEPLANLDAKLRVHMRTELQRLHQKLDTTIVYVTHDQAEAMTMSDRIAILNKGELQQFAPPLECYNYPVNLFVAGFIGSPSMHFVNGTINDRTFEGSGSKIIVDIGDNENIKSGQEVILGIRPEDVYLADKPPVSNTSRTFSLKVDVVQPMGDQILIYLYTDDENQHDITIDENDEPGTSTGQLLMSVGSERSIDTDDVLDVVFDLSKAHLFDPKSGKTIVHGLGQTSATNTQ